MRDGSGGPPRRAPWGVVGSLVLLVGACLVALFVSSPDDAKASHDVPHDVPNMVEFEQDGLRYVFHVPTGREALFDLATDPDALSNLAEKRPEDTLRLRGLLSGKYGVEDLDALRVDFQDSIDALRRLGYL